MKKWQKVILCAVCAVAVLAVGGSCIYRYYIVPKYLEPMLVEAGKILDDEDIQKEMIAIAEELADEGMIDSRTLQEYIAANNIESQGGSSSSSRTGINTKTSGNSSDESSFAKNQDLADTETEKGLSSPTGSNISEVQGEDDDRETKQSSETAKTELGIENIKVNDEGSRKKYSYNNDNVNNVETEIAGRAENDGTNQESSQTNGDKELAELAKNSGQSLYNKVMSAMTKEEREKAIDIGMKIDQEKAISLLETDKSELKKYLKSILTEQEYADGVNLYLKYSYLLTE